MFGISFWTIGLMLVCGGLVVLIQTTPLLQHFKRRIAALIGVFLVLASFLFQPWIRLNFIEYLVNIPQSIKDLLPEGVVKLVIDRLGVDWLGRLLEIVGNVTSLSGWKIQFIPTYGFWTHFWMLAPVILVFPVALGILFGSLLHGRAIPRILGGVLAVFSLILFLGLLFSLPDIDTLGIHHNFQWSLLAAMVGAKLGNGPWFMCLGLLFWVIGGIVDLMEQPPSTKKMLEELSSSWEGV